MWDMTDMYRGSPQRVLSDCDILLQGALQYMRESGQSTPAWIMTASILGGGVFIGDNNDYYWSPGGFRQFARAEVQACGSCYSINFTHHIEDVQTYSKYKFLDMDKWNAEGLARDYYTTGEFHGTFKWCPGMSTNLTCI